MHSCITNSICRKSITFLEDIHVQTVKGLRKTLLIGQKLVENDILP